MKLTPILAWDYGKLCILHKRVRGRKKAYIKFHIHKMHRMGIAQALSEVME